jgi:hypothetical protein
MRKFWLASSVVAMFVLGGLIDLSGPSKAQVNSEETPPLDYTAVFKTHVPHANIHFQSGKPSSKPGGGGGKPGGGGGGGGSSIFTGPGFNPGWTTVNATSSIPEAEEHIAVDPTNGNNLVAMISDFSLRGGYNTSKYAFSNNNGSGGSWTQAFVPLGTGQKPATSDGQTWDANSDPVVAIDNGGRVYLANLYFNATNGNSAGGLYVSVGSLGLNNLGITQASTYPVATNLDPNTTTDEDKEWIAVDNSGGSHDGTVYVSWTRFVGNTDFILVSSSTDQGQTWSAPIQISPTSQNGAVQGSQIAVGPKGEVYVVYEVYFVRNTRAQYMAKSTNGGASFSPAVAITPQFSELKFNSTYRKSSFASLAVSPSSDGTVYVVYPDQPKNSSSRIEFTVSKNGGGSFSSPVTISDSTTGERLMPSVAVDDSGYVSASWFDTRNGSSTAYYDIYATRTADAGTSFSPNARVTKNGQIYASNASFIGDYGGIAAGSSYAHPVWTSGGFNNGRLQTAALGYLGP